MVKADSSSDDNPAEDPLDLFDALLNDKSLDSPPSDYSPAEEKSTMRIASSSRQSSVSQSPRPKTSISGSSRPIADGLGRTRLAPHMSGPSRSTSSRRPSSPTRSSLSAAGVSTISSAFTQISMGQAVRSYNSDKEIKPIARDDDAVTAPKSSKMFAQAAGIDLRRPQLDMRPNRQGPARPVPLGRQTLPSRLAPNGLPPRPPPMARRNFEIRIGNIPRGAKKDEVYHLLADGALHRYPFSSRERKLNFWIHLPTARATVGSWGQMNDGFG